MRRFFQGSTVLALVLVLVGTLASTADASTRKIALGVAYFNTTQGGSQTNGGYADLSLADTYHSQTGRYPAIWEIFNDWGGANNTFPTALMNAIHAKSASMVPLVTWQPLDPGESTSTLCSDWQLDTITNGSHDAYIHAWAQAAAAYKHTILLRFAHEMNGDWFVWGTPHCNNTASKYVATWRYVWNIFRAEGATNVKWVWNPSGKKNLGKFYPGNTYVDYVGVTAFNWGGYSGFKWRTMVTAFATTMTPLARAGIKKPVIGAEVGTAPDMNGCSTCIQSQWITQGYPAVYAKWPSIKAIVYFDVNMLPIKPTGTQPDWRYERTSDSLNAYEGIAHLAKFQGTLPSV